MQDLIIQHDSPISTISYYVHSFLSEKISKSGFKVAISGTELMKYLQVIMIITYCILHQLIILELKIMN